MSWFYYFFCRIKAKHSSCPSQPQAQDVLDFSQLNESLLDNTRPQLLNDTIEASLTYSFKEEKNYVVKHTKQDIY